MDTYKYFINLIPRGLRIFFKMLYYRIKYFPYGSFYFTTREALKQLVKHINLYFYYNAAKKKEYCEEIRFLNESNNKSGITTFIFPYSFVLKYKHEGVEVNVDNETGLLYVMHKGKKLFYNRDYITKEGVQRRYNAVCIEQDEKSPHRYLSNAFNIDDNSVVADIGAAEGNFSIEIIDKAKMLYIFDSDNKWVEALNKTFEPWKHKVQIINKYVSNVNNETCITLDSFFNEKTVDFIKLDVEGAEISVLERACVILSRNPRVKLFTSGWENYNLNQVLLFKKLLLIEDSSHTYENTIMVLRKFANSVSIGSYFIVENGIVNELGMKREFNGGPLRAINEFLKSREDYIVDRKWTDLFGRNATFNVKGYLKKIKQVISV